MANTRFKGLVAALLLAATPALLPSMASAYTAEQEQACTSDAFRLCSSDIPNVDRVTACMIRNKPQLSPPCRAQFGPEPRAAASSRAGKPMSIQPEARKPVSARSSKPKKTAKPAAT